MSFLAHKKSKIIFVSLVLLIIPISYLWFANAYIYWKIGSAGLPAVNGFGSEKDFAGRSSGNKTVLVTLGDSLMSGAGAATPEDSLPYKLAGKIAGGGGVSLHNFSVPGFRTADLVQNLLSSAILVNPDTVVILIGVNDVHGRVPITDFEKNYREILGRLTTETHARVYISAIPFIGASTLIWPPLQYHFDTKTREYNEVIERLAREYSVSYLDLYTPTHETFLKAGSHYSADLFHPSSVGYEIWATTLYDRINH